MFSRQECGAPGKTAKDLSHASQQAPGVQSGLEPGQACHCASCLLLLATLSVS